VQDNRARHMPLMGFDDDSDAYTLAPDAKHQRVHGGLAAPETMVPIAVGRKNEPIEITEVIVDDAFDLAGEFVFILVAIMIGFV
jgi:hypothetical protein